MAEIAPLTPHVIDQLCAGEVVERPASIVKELVENAIDAGATEISVELRDGGRAGVTVTDNGSGIDFDQMPNAVKPHYTSKLQTLNDLYNLRTMGFRGEALGAIAAVSRLHLTSRTPTADNAGELYVEASQLQYHRPAAFNVGTRIEVRDIFFNIPVRRKFLKARRTEAANAIARIIEYSLIHPNIAFKLLTENVTEYQSSGSGNLKEILAVNFGESVVSELIEFDCEHNGYRATGYISAPHLHLTHRNYQKIFINQRPAKNSAVIKAVSDSTVEFMTPGKYPYLCLFLSVPPEMIDVNVHPTKAEVALSDTGTVYYVISMALKKALDSRLTSKFGKVVIKSGIESEKSSVAPNSLELKSSEHNLTKRIEFQAAANAKPEQVYQKPVENQYRSEQNAQSQPTAIAHLQNHEAERVSVSTEQIQKASITSQVNLEPDPQSVATEQASWEHIRHSEIKILGQIASAYVAFIAGTELYLIDQHAAHERVLFGKLWNEYESGRLMKATQDLMFPYMLTVPQDVAHIVKDLQPVMLKLGFGIASGAANTVLVKSIPSLLSAVITENAVLETLLEVAAEFSKGLGRTAVPEAITNRVKLLCATLACKAAIKAGTPLNMAQQRALLEELIQPEVGSTCPHGRPVLVTLSEQEISKLFLRS